jgi:uncharacterized protein YlzI (FlbEa/FlbD family)
MSTKKEQPKKVSTKKVATKKTPVKKDTVKKEVIKKEVIKQKEIKAQLIAKNLITLIDGKKYVLKTPSANVVKSITNKIKLYNKKNSDMLLEEILLLVDVKIVEEQKKEAIKKGIKKEIKISEKKTKTKVEVPTLSLAEQIKTKLASNDLSEQERKELRNLLKEEKEE